MNFPRAAPEKPDLKAVSGDNEAQSGKGKGMALATSWVRIIRQWMQDEEKRRSLADNLERAANVAEKAARSARSAARSLRQP
jgi:hypothetical protein